MSASEIGRKNNNFEPRKKIKWDRSEWISGQPKCEPSIRMMKSTILNQLKNVLFFFLWDKRISFFFFVVLNNLFWIFLSRILSVRFVKFRSSFVLITSLLRRWLFFSFNDFLWAVFPISRLRARFLNAASFLPKPLVFWDQLVFRN